MEEKYPHLAERAKELNSRDDFVMKYDPNGEALSKKPRESESQERTKTSHSPKRSKVERVVSP